MLKPFKSFFSLGYTAYIAREDYDATPLAHMIKQRDEMRNFLRNIEGEIINISRKFKDGFEPR